ncbi:MAG: Multimodular transpeptidase-transglycosylase, partial [uncultured Thermomicrobiales bacterium]
GRTAARQGGGIGKIRVILLALTGLFAIGVLGLGLFIAATAAAVGGTVRAYKEVNDNLPNAAAIAVDTFQTTRIFDRDGALLQEVDDPNAGWRTFVPLDQISPYLIDATVAAEDATFWTHRGVEPLAIVRGVAINAGGSGSSGGSTITQQLVRSLFTDIGYELSYTRKGKEALAAIEVERQFSKQDILTMYLNQIFYGNRSYGIEAAAQTFFDKHAKDLTLGEASLLAGLPQRPTDYNPVVNYELAKGRQIYVLDQMVKHGYVTRAEADAAFLEPLKARDRSGAILENPHFVNFIRGYVSERFGEDALLRGGLQITTSIDTQLQNQAEEIVAQQVRELESYRASNAAMVAIAPWSGEVLAMVGSADFNDAVIEGQNNVAILPQQPGSSIKPIAYAAAFEAGWNPGTVIMDTSFKQETPWTDPVTGQEQKFYEPQNYTGQFYGAVTVRTALSNSLNIPAVKALEYTGVGEMIELAHRMGLKNSLQEDPSFYGLSLALGGGEVQLLELTNAYATFANNGRYVEANPIRKITDSAGNVLYDIARDHRFEQAPQVLKAEHAYQITSILTDDESRRMLFGADNRFETTQEALGRPTAAKSGTTNDVKDIWTMGYTTDLAVGVWVGNTDNTQMVAMDGIQGAGPIWEKVMLELHRNPAYADLLLGPGGKPLPEEFAKPPDLYRGDLCAATGHRAGGGDSRQEWLVRGEGPALRCDQLSAYERKELQAAMKDIDRNGGKYASGGTSSVRRYADAARYWEYDTNGGDFSGTTPTPEGGG